MSEEYGFSISMVLPIKKMIESKGLDFQQFCDAISFDVALLQETEARINESEMERLMKEAAKYTQDAHFGLHQGQFTDVADLRILGYVMMHSGNVAKALEAYQRYNMILCNGYNISWSVEGDELCLRLYSQSNRASVSRHCVEDMMSSLYYFITRMTHQQITIHRLQFKHLAPDDLTPYISMFQVEPEFEQEKNLIIMHKNVLDLPILYSDQRIRQAFEQIAEEAKRKLLHGQEISYQVYEQMLECIPLGIPTLQQMALFFNMSTRSLQIKLKEENSSYNEILARARKELAEGYLSRVEHSLSEIAYLLHFSEPSAFHSAFKKWTGHTPGQYRERMIRNELV